jgi:hypothetical protein
MMKTERNKNISKDRIIEKMAGVQHRPVEGATGRAG